MDPSPDRIISGERDHLDYIVAYGQRIKVHRINSKDKLNKAFQELMNNINNEKKKITSKLPRVIKVSNVSNCDKRDQSLGLLSRSDPSGDCLEGPSKRYSPTRMRHEGLGATKKPSLIPRRKISSNTYSCKENEKKTPDYSYFANDSHIQRVYLPNLSPDFCQDEFSATTSLASTRPIPTLGQIYGPNNVVIEGDTFYDWYMEFDVPRSSQTDTSLSNGRVRRSSDSANTVRNIIDDKRSTFEETNPPVEISNTKVNNDKCWVANETEYPTKEKESGYSSLYPGNQNPVSIQSKHSGTDIKQTQEDTAKLAKKSEHFDEVELNTDSVRKVEKKPTLVEQPTVVITQLPSQNAVEYKSTKSDKALEPIVMVKSEFSKITQFPSTSSPESKPEAHDTLPSYVDCASEILQKTTNFEADGGNLSCDSRNTTSSMAETDLEIRDDYSSQFELGQVDDCSVVDDQPSMWCQHHCKSQSCITFTKSVGSGTDRPNHSLHCVCHGRRIDSSGVIQSKHGSKHHCCRVRHIHGDAPPHCKTQRYRRFPSCRYKLTHPFNNLRKRLFITGMCQRRWCHVWKRTWSRRTRSPRLSKSRMLEYLQNPSLWEDVDVQTLTLVFHETGTHTNMAELKTMGVGTSLKLSQSENTNTELGTSARSFKSHIRHINLGPSRFPFSYHSKPTSMLPISVTSKTVGSHCSSQDSQTLYNVTYDVNYSKPVPTVNTPKVSKCACSKETTDTVSSPIEIHNMKTIEMDTDTFALFRVNDKCTSNAISLQDSRCMPTTADNEMETSKFAITFNSTATDVAYLPYSEGRGLVTPINPFSFYKPIGVNTESNQPPLDLLVNHSVQISPSTFEDAMPQANSKPRRVKQTSKFKSGWPKRWMRSKKKPTTVPASSQSSRKTAEETKDTLKEDSSVEAPLPCLTFTDTRIVSISSARMIETPITSAEDVGASSDNQKPSDTPRSSTMKCQCSTEKSMFCTCHKPCNTGADPVNELSRPSVNNQLSQTDPDTGAKQSKTEQKSTYVYAIFDQKSAYTVMSKCKETQSNVSSFRKKADKTCTYTSYSDFQSETRSVGLTTEKTSNIKSRPRSIIDTWAQYSQITNDSLGGCSEQHLRTARIGRSKLISTQVLNESKCDISTQARPSYNDTEAEANLSRITPQKKSISVMMSRPIGGSPKLAYSKERYNRLMCGCADVNRETSTLSNRKNTRNMECSTRSIVHLSVNALDKSTSSNHFNKDENLSASKTTRTTAERLISLSRAIGDTQSDLQDDRSQTINPSFLSSNMNAEKWITRCTKAEKDYQSIIDVEEFALKALKQASNLIADAKKTRSQKSTKSNSTMKSMVFSNLRKVEPLSPAHTTSDDSILDVRPVDSSFINCHPNSVPVLKSMVDSVTSGENIPKQEDLQKIRADIKEIVAPPSTPVAPLNNYSVVTHQQVNNFTDGEKETLAKKINKCMVDKVTSGQLIAKQLKESILQTNPDIKEAATVTEKTDQKTECVYTSRCVLPKPLCCPCGASDHECLFVYDKPRCAVHKTYLGTAYPSSKKEYTTVPSKHSERQVFHQHSVIQPSNLYSRVEEVLSPKVYEALYETTKLIVKDQKCDPVKDNDMDIIPSRERNDKSAKNLAIRSAAMVTSQCGLHPSKCHCNHEIPKEPRPEPTEYVFDFDTPQMSVLDVNQRVNYHARVLEMPSYHEPGVVQEHLKTELVGSCRYYSNLLTKRLGLLTGRSKDEKYRQDTDQFIYLSTIEKQLSCTEACTMKPSGRQDLGCQTYKAHKTRSFLDHEVIRPFSCCVVTPSLTDICNNDKHHLKSVYFMLSAIEGRIRRLKRNIPK